MRGTSRRAAPLRASRLVLFQMYYLGGAEYQAARRLLGISERTWAYWAEEIRHVVGRELLRKGMCPPSRYFKETGTRVPAGSGPKDRCERVA